MQHTIIKLFDTCSQEELDVAKLTLKQTIAPASNTKEPVWRFFYNDVIIKKHNDLRVHYTCHTCQRVNIVSLNNIARKLNKGILFCNTCKNQQPSKTSKQSEFMSTNQESIRDGTYVRNAHKSKISPSLQEKLAQDVVAFDSMDSDFQNEYFKIHMTKDEFERIRSKIVSFQNDKFPMSDIFQYYPCVSIPNQTKFNPYIYDKARDVLEKITYVKYTCESCGDFFINRDLYVQKNKYKILCRDCNFCNNSFKIRSTKNIKGNAITYQSQYELKFIKFCNEHNIELLNGPKIPYVHNNRNLTYKVDFLLPKQAVLIELKDNHHWHKGQLHSGKWSAKEKTAMEYALSNSLTYVVVLPKQYVSFCKSILNQDKI